MEKIRNLFKKIQEFYKSNCIALIGSVFALVVVIVLVIVLIISCAKNTGNNKENASDRESIVEDTTKEPETTTPEVPTTTQPPTMPAPTEPATQPVQTGSNGISKLKVRGTKLVNESGQVVVLNGVSTHGIAWFPQYVNKEAFKSLKDTFGANVEEAVEYATALGMYVIIDWHILGDGNPNIYKSQAISFFNKMSAKYKDYNNVLYEICNEPNGCSWSSDVKPYAIDVIKTIRANDPDGIILIGSTTWSQDVDVVANDPITGYDNIMYTLHFYAATHKEWNQQKLIDALNKGIPVFVSEFSICDASGNGQNDVASANTWMNILNQYNISFVGWNLSNKAESSSIIISSCNKTSGWTDSDLTESGKWLVEQLRSH